jgi:hypothetical protein
LVRIPAWLIDEPVQGLAAVFDWVVNVEDATRKAGCRAKLFVERLKRR